MPVDLKPVGPGQFELAPFPTGLIPLGPTELKICTMNQCSWNKINQLNLSQLSIFTWVILNASLEMSLLEIKLSFPHNKVINCTIRQLIGNVLNRDRAENCKHRLFVTDHTCH